MNEQDGSANTAFTIDLDSNNNINKLGNKNDHNESSTSQDRLNEDYETSSHHRNVRLIYCGDGVVEHDEEEEAEKARKEEEEKQKWIEMQEKLEKEAVST
jgi:hypothetical protein